MLHIGTKWKCFTLWSETTSQARLLEFGEDVKKRLRLLSEVARRAVKRSLTASFAIFFAFKNAFLGLPSFYSGYPAFLAKKWRRERDSNPR